MSIQSAGEQEERSTTMPGATAVAIGEELAPARRGPFSLRDLLPSELGQIPVFIGLVAIAIYFQIAGKGFFLSAQNLGNLALQIVTISILAVAAVLVLLIAEIDLSLSAAAYLCGAVMGVLSTRQGWSAPEAILAGIATGALIGLINGFFVAIVRMPSFIVTLAGFIGYQGLLSKILEPQTTLPIRDNAINNIAIYNLPDYLGVGVPVIALVLYAAGILLSRARRQRAGLSVQPTGQLALQVGLPVVLTLVVVAGFESYQGVPLVSLVMISIIVLFWLLTTKT